MRYIDAFIGLWYVGPFSTIDEHGMMNKVTEV